MTPFSAWLASSSRDFWLVYSFLTRLPAPVRVSAAPGELARALRLAPLVGLFIGICGTLAYWLAAGGLGLPPILAALLALAAIIWVTGALHEDGLADVADGFGGAFEPARKLDIMRDSCTGTYGVLALIISVGLRATAVALIAIWAGAEAVMAVLISAHGLSRGVLAMVMWLLAPVRDDGLAAAAGRASGSDALTGLCLGLLLAVLASGVLGLIFGLAALAGALLMAFLAARQIGGLTGDVLGAVQQVAEIAVFLGAAAVLV